MPVHCSHPEAYDAPKGSVPLFCEPLISPPRPASPLPRPSSAILDIPIDLGQPVELLRTVAAWAARGARGG